MNERSNKMGRYRLMSVLGTAAWVGAVGVGAVAVGHRAHAQSSAGETPQAAKPADPGEDTLGEIVVTGTLIRGTAPVGTEVITTTHEDIVNSGVVTSQDLLATIPAVSSLFNSVPTVGTGAGGITTVRPNIHGLGASGGNTTLVLFDGHNVVGAGILQTTPDIGILPPAVLDRVEVIDDGGSAIYGADAVGGIVNFITRKKMEGVEADVHYGKAAQYHTEDANLSAGHEWGDGSFMLSYSYRTNTDLFGADRGYFRQNLAPYGGTDRRVATCSPGNVATGNAFFGNAMNYALPGLVPGTQNLCDQDLHRDLFPAETQSSVFGSLQQELGGGVSLDLTGYYTSRHTKLLQAQDTSTGTITAANPYFIPVGGAASESVQYSYADAAGFSNMARTNIDEFGITPQIKVKLGGDWDLTAYLNYGRSKTEAHTPEINAGADAAALGGTTLATALDPYATAQTNPAVLAGILQYEQYARNVQQLAETRVVAQGSAFDTPGGAARGAAGVQYTYQSESALQTDAPYGDLTGAPTASANQKVASVFGELMLPLVGRANALPGIRSLDIDLSARYDHYNDFGGTTNPKVAFDWKPIDDVTLRGSYSTSFVAPSLADEAGSVDTRAQFIGVSPFGPNGFHLSPTYLLAGGGPALKPERGRTYTFGADYKPEWLPTTTASLTYWHTKVSEEITVYPFFAGPAYFTNYPNLYVVNPTEAQAQTFVQSILGPNYRTQGPTLAQVYAAGNPPYAILDAQRSNVGAEKVEGLDFNVNYRQPTSFGSVTGVLAGTYTLSHTQQIAPGQPYISEFQNAGTSLGGSRLLMTAQAGATMQQFTARASINYTSGFVVQSPMQNFVGAFHPLNLLFAYDFKTAGPLQDITATLNVNNVLNEQPAFQNQTGGNTPDGTGNGSTWGRFFDIGLHAKF